jgi:hypothetical protein
MVSRVGGSVLHGSRLPGWELPAQYCNVSQARLIYARCVYSHYRAELINEVRTSKVRKMRGAAGKRQRGSAVLTMRPYKSSPATR